MIKVKGKKKSKLEKALDKECKMEHKTSVWQKFWTWFEYYPMGNSRDVRYPVNGGKK